MKKSTINKFASCALAVSKMNKRTGIMWQHKDGEYTVACDYMFLQFADEFTFRSIVQKVGEAKMIPSSCITDAVNGMLKKGNVHLTDTRLVSHETSGAYVRFLTGDSFAVAVNEEYLDVFACDHTDIMGSGTTEPVLILGDGYIGGILPIRTSAKDARFQRAAHLLKLYGVTPEADA